MKKLQIDIVSDVMCPWCIVGYKGLQKALQQLAPDVQANINWLPFELNPDMPNEGQNIKEHLIEKYGITEQQSAQNSEMLKQRGKEVDFDFNFAPQMRMINSFDCHRLLAWAKQQDKQHVLQMALFSAHFTQNMALNDRKNLIKIVASVGLDINTANDLLDSDAYAKQVRAEQKTSQERGIQAVPTFIINHQYSISGGQTAEAFQEILTDIVKKL
ncbi:DsbA family oxidoreductase [Psychromonas hadalis]|uniref:DsbA family oxidoreductase n=1 Tax=Psychromonas hadalis TaxID=211669 RepID=UPI0003B3828A|nr:DsbA family oxidoreductase [Psychromonas hadalis]